MYRHRPTRGVLVVLSLIAVIATPAGATEKEGRIFAHSYIDIDAFKGYQGIRTDPATVTGVGYVHFSQVDIGAAAGDWIGIGTANGNGADTTQCADDYDPLWTVYTDGVLGGVYFCVDEQLDAYAAGSNPFFKIEWAYCTSQSGYRWMLWFGGGLKNCIYSSSANAIGVGAALETTGISTTDRNIDVKFTGLYTSLVYNPNWFSVGSGSSVHAPNYSYQYVSTTAFNVYLAPLD